jgi:hypothetical protein
MPFVASRVFGWEPVEITEDWHLRDLQCGMAYSVCNTLKCNECGLIFLDIRFDDSEMAALYKGYRDEEYTALRTRFEPNYHVQNSDLLEGYAYIPHVEEFLRERIGQVESVLDFGGDTGLNTPFRREVAVHHVYDISDKDVIEGAQRVEAHETIAHEYDLVVVSQVLEHVPFPQEIVADVVQAMGPNTVLWVEVPHEAVIREAANPEEAYLAKRHWHEHVNFFTEDALTRMLEGAGLNVVERTTLAVVVCGQTVNIRGAVCKLPGSPHRVPAMPAL